MILYVEKDTDLMRSTFMAVGLAKLFHELSISGGLGGEVRIVDQGGVYAIEVPYSREEAHAALSRRFEERLPQIIPALRKAFTEKERAALEKEPASVLIYKYVPNGFPQAHTVEYETINAAIKSAPKKVKGEARTEGESDPRPPDYPVWAHLCSYFGKGSAMRVGYPSVLHAWYAHQGDHAHALLDLMMNGFGEPFTDLDALHAEWRGTLLKAIQYTDYPLSSTVSALAVVSPTTSKGGASITGAAQLVEDTPNEFWLPMALAFAGYMEIAMPYNRESDVLNYYPIPRDIAYERLRDAMRAFRRDETARRLYSFSNAVDRAKLDVLAALIFYRALLDHVVEQQPDEFFGDAIEAYSGLVGYYYKDIGGTQIPFDEVLFALPRWLPHEPAPDALEEARHLINVHHDLIDAIRGKAPKYKLTGDELVVLNAYRSFMTRGEASLWIEFAIAYNLYHFRNMPDLYLPALHLTVFERTLMYTQDRQDYRPILANTGFQHIAAAIRSATVWNRYQDDVKHSATGFKTRHGLGDDLLRNAGDAALFIKALSDFLHDYARETLNAQAKDNNLSRPFVTQDDLTEIVGLIAEYGSQVVAYLLVAAGYSTNYKSASAKSD